MTELTATAQASGAPAAEHPKPRTARVHKSGNSRGIYIPRDIADYLHIEALAEVRLYVIAGVLCVEPIREDSFRPSVVEAPAEADGQPWVRTEP